MFNVTFVNLRYWFYAIGNTPAVNLLRDRPLYGAAHDEVVKVLLLACGDPRNLLFSLWCDGEEGNRFYEFTCCDWEPAVLARNVVLYTLLADGDYELSAANGRLWNLFYHFYVPEGDLLVLQDHASKLVHMSESLETWRSSPFGNLIQFLSQDTLVQLRKYWSLYANTKTFTKAHKGAFEGRARTSISTLHEKHAKDRWVTQGCRSAGAFSIFSSLTMGQAFKNYWETGVVGGNGDDVNALGNGGKGWVNPMFVFSSASTGDFALHYGSDPLIGFHLAEAFNDGKIETARVSQVVGLAKSQFRNWCARFLEIFKKGRIQIRIFNGEAIRLCYELQYRHDPALSLARLIPVYVGPWTSRPLVLDGLEETSIDLFDVVDTSNLVDYVGILHVLLAATPLLSRRECSVLYTESLLETSKDVTSSLSQMLCSDVVAFSLIIGLAPMGHLLGITTDAVGNESLEYAMQQHDGPRQYRMRIPWRVPELGDIKAVEALNDKSIASHKIGFDAEELAKYFFKLYLQMFSDEDLNKRLSVLNRDPQTMKLLSGDLQYYTRFTIVILLYTAKKNVLTDWKKCIDCLLEMVENDQSLFIGSNSLQELHTYLRLCGVRDSKDLDEAPRHLLMTPNGPLRPASEEKGVLAKVRFPPVVFVTLVIPRKNLAVFTSQSPNSLGTPGIHLSVAQLSLFHGFDNSFFACQCFFGKVKAHNGCRDTCDVEEDPRGWMGSEDLIATCPVPTFMLLLGPRIGIQVSLRVNTSLSTNRFRNQLGVRMVVYECGLDDERRLWITEQAPGIIGWEPYSAGQIEELPHSKADPVAHAIFDDEFQVTDLQIRTEFTGDSDKSKALANGAKVSTTRSSPCMVLLEVKGFAPHRLVYPFPIDGSSSKVRISRKCSWVEVGVPVAPALVRGGYDSDLFSIVRNSSETVAWGFPYVKLEQQPSIPVPGNFRWLPSFMGLTLSQNEKEQHALPPEKRPVNWLRELKDSISTVLQSFVGLNPLCGPIRNFNLSRKRNNSADADTLLIATAIRHDRDGGSVLLDAYVIPLTKSRLAMISTALVQFVKTNPVDILLSDEESVLWKQMLPLLAERCRHTWIHKESCEYRVQGRTPLGTGHGENPLCSCGEGQALQDFPKGSWWSTLARHATRIAMSPIFPVPYIEPLFSIDWGKATEGATEKVQKKVLQSPASGCNYCGSEQQALKVCAACRKVEYCSRECQKAAWKEHKRTCAKN